VWEADDRRGEDVGAVQQLGGKRDIGRANRRGGHAVPASQLNSLTNEREIELRAQQRVVDRLRNLFVRQTLNGRLGHDSRIVQ
jgi:hypothetical protein